jgi:amino acid transporter
MASFVGMELAGVHTADIANPKKNFPKATGVSVLVLLGALGIGSLSIALVIPSQSIHFVDGVMQTFSIFLAACGLSSLIPVLAVLIIAGAIGGSVNWVLAPAKGLMQAGAEGFLPDFLLIKNKMGVAHRLLILQALVVSAFCYALYFVSSLNNYYWFLMALSTGLYMLMYIVLFLAALKLKRPKENNPIPYGFRTILCIFGIASCAITILLGFQPAPNVTIENKTVYIFTIAAGFFLLLIPVLFLWIYQKRKIGSLLLMKSGK